MNNQKVEQVLREIFDKYGTEIVQENTRFRAAILDSLDQWNDKEERIIFKHVTETDALRILFAPKNITADTAERAVLQLRKESRMSKEDAEFAIQCVVAAVGGNPDIVAENTKQQKAEEERMHQAEGKQQKQEEDNQSKVQETCILEIGCEMEDFSKAPKTVECGKLRLYQDRMEFASDEKVRQTESFCYNDIKISQFARLWITIILLIFISVFIIPVIIDLVSIVIIIACVLKGRHSITISKAGKSRYRFQFDKRSGYAKEVKDIIRSKKKSSKG